MSGLRSGKLTRCPPPYPRSVLLPCWSYIWGAAVSRGGWRQVGGGQQLRAKGVQKPARKPQVLTFLHTHSCFQPYCSAPVPS